jgi:hypothetical protein
MSVLGGVGGRALRGLLICAAVVLLILLIRTWNPGRPPPMGPPPPLRTGEGAQIVSVERSGGTFDLRLERQRGTWRMVAPLGDLARARSVRELLRGLEELAPRRILTTADRAPYGLEPPRYRLVLRTTGGREIEFWVGDAAPASGGVYAWWAGLDGVALLAPAITERFFSDDLLFWRERELLPPARSVIDSTWVFWPEEKARMLRLGQERWAFLEPSDREADGLSCERTVAAFWRFQFMEFFDDPGTWQDLGLDPPLATWIVFRAGRVDTLRIGRRLSAGEMVVQLAGRSPGRVRDDLLEYLTGGVAVLEARQVVRGRWREQELVAVAAPAAGRAFRRRGGRWQTRALRAGERAALRGGTAPDTAGGTWQRADDPALGGDLARLFELKGEAWLERRAAPPRAEDTALRVHLWDRTGTHQWVYFCQDAAAGGAPGRDASSDALPALEVVIGSRFPRRPMRVPSTVAVPWQLRAGGQVGGDSPAPR